MKEWQANGKHRISVRPDFFFKETLHEYTLESLNIKIVSTDDALFRFRFS